VTIGARVVIYPGVVIGADGFGLANDGGVWIKVPQLGGVRIGDDVEIGANTTIDRGALDDTVIEQTRMSDDAGIAGLVAQSGQAIRVDADTTEPLIKERMQRPEIASALVAPLRDYRTRQIIGVLSVNRLHQGARFTDDDVQPLEQLIDVASLACANTHPSE